MNILDTIVGQKRDEVSRLPLGEVTVEQVSEVLRERGGVRAFGAALARPNRGAVALIAEVKKASPSAGVIRPDFDPVAIARDYEAAGADGLSVLTDEKFFQGSLEYLRSIRPAVALPLLRKDFVIDERQILEAAVWGADAVLLIVAILDDNRLRRLHDLAVGSGLTALVEVHDAAELDRALAVGARYVGVNNRDLRTFQVDLATTEGLANRLREAGRLTGDDRVLLVAESGIHTRDDVRRLEACGAGAILVGESLMRARDGVASKVTELMGSRMCRGEPLREIC